MKSIGTKLLLVTLVFMNTQFACAIDNDSITEAVTTSCSQASIDFIKDNSYQITAGLAIAASSAIAGKFLFDYLKRQYTIKKMDHYINLALNNKVLSKLLIKLIDNPTRLKLFIINTFKLHIIKTYGTDIEMMELFEQRLVIAINEINVKNKLIKDSMSTPEVSSKNRFTADLLKLKNRIKNKLTVVKKKLNPFAQQLKS